VRIRLRLALLFAAGTALLVGVGGMVFLHQLHHGLIRSVDSALRTRADTVIQAIPDGSGAADFQKPGTRTSSPGQAIREIIGADGKVVDSSEALGRRRLLTASDLARARRGAFAVTASSERAELEPTRLLAVPFSHRGQVWVAVVGGSLQSTDNAIQRVRNAIVFFGPPIVLLSGVAAWLLAGAALHPVERMRRQVAELSEDDADAELQVPGTHDEIAALAETMNGLLVRLQQALARQRAFAADAAHELRTPLAILGVELELAGRPTRTREELVSAVAAAADETERLTRLAEDLLLLASNDDGRPALRREVTSLAAVLGESVSTATPRADARNVRLEVDSPAGVVALVDAARLRQALDNLVENALRFAPQGTAVELVARRTGDRVVIEVSDSGPGFPATFLPHAFERFRRADQSRARQDGGTGLGLAIVSSIAEAHGGRAGAKNRPGGGATVWLDLPIGEQPPVPTAVARGSRQGDGPV
jgi:heavy metal sensor kinase